MRFKLGTKEYETASVEDVTLHDTLVFEKQMRELGRPMAWPELMQMIFELAQISDPVERGKHPDGMWSLAVTIWASRRAAGEDVTVAQAADFRLSDLEWLPDEPEPGPDPTEAQPEALGVDPDQSE